MKTPSLFAGVLALSLAACQPRVPQARPPSDREADAEKVIAPAVAAPLLVAAPDPAQVPGYQLYAGRGDEPSFAAVATTSEARAPGFVPRAAHIVVVAGQVFVAPAPAPAGAAGTPAGSAIDAKILHLRTVELVANPATDPAPAATDLRISLPQPCTQTGPALLQADGDKIHALLRCPAEGYALLLAMDRQGHIQRSRRVPAAADATLFLHQPDGDYLAVARQVLRVPESPADALPVIGTVPPPGGDSDTRELLRHGDLLLIVDGAAGRVIGMDAGRMGWRFEKRFYSQGTVVRLRSLPISADRLCVVTAEETPAGRELFATQIALSDMSSQPPQRLALGGVTTAAHELLPLGPSAGGGALLLYTATAGAGPSLRSRRLAP